MNWVRFENGQDNERNCGSAGSYFPPLSKKKSNVLKLNLSGWCWLIKFYGFQGCKSIIHHLYIYLFGVKYQRGSAARTHSWLSQGIREGSHPSIRSPLPSSQFPAAQAPLSPSPSPPIHGIIFCDADVLPMIDHPPLSRGPESDLLDAFVRNQLGNKNKNLKASSGGPEIRGPRTLFH